jgi:hypothetical protein
LGEEEAAAGEKCGVVWMAEEEGVQLALAFLVLAVVEEMRDVFEVVFQ